MSVIAARLGGLSRLDAAQRKRVEGAREVLDTLVDSRQVGAARRRLRSPSEVPVRGEILVTLVDDS